MSNVEFTTALTDAKGRVLVPEATVSMSSLHADYRGIVVAYVSWESATVNNRDYGWSRAEVVFSHRSGFYVSFSSFHDFTDSARTKLEEAILTNDDIQPLMVEPTTEEVAHSLLESARRSGAHEGSMNSRIPTGELRSMADLANIHLGRSTGMFLPEAPGIPTEKDLQLAYLEAMQAEIAAKIKKLEA